MAVLLKWIQKILQIVHSRGAFPKKSTRKPKKTRKATQRESVQLVEFHKLNSTQIAIDNNGKYFEFEDTNNLKVNSNSSVEVCNPMLWSSANAGASGLLRLNEIEKIEELDVKIETIRAMRNRNSVQITSIFDMAGGYFHMSITSNLNMNTADYFASSQISTFIERITFDKNAIEEEHLTKRPIIEEHLSKRSFISLGTSARLV